MAVGFKALSSVDHLTVSLPSYVDGPKVICLATQSEYKDLVIRVSNVISETMRPVQLVISNPLKWKRSLEVIKSLNSKLVYNCYLSSLWVVTLKPESCRDISPTIQSRTYPDGIKKIISTVYPEEHAVYFKETILIRRFDSELFDVNAEVFIRSNGDVSVTSTFPLPSVFMEGYGEVALFFAPHIDMLIPFVKEKDAPPECYVSTALSSQDVLLAFCRHSQHSLSKIFSGPSKHLNEFVRNAVKPGASGISELSQWPSTAALGVLQSCVSRKVTPPSSEMQRKLLHEILAEPMIRRKKHAHYTKFFEWCPEAFKTFYEHRDENLTKFLSAGVPAVFYATLLKEACLDTDFDSKFRLFFAAGFGYAFTKREQTLFETVDKDTQKEIENIAKVNGNPHIYLPSDRTISPRDYTINFLWWNKDCLPDDHTRLFGIGDTEAEKEADFSTRFVYPISEWAKKNPGTQVFLWYDGIAVSDATTRAVTEKLNAALGIEDGTSPFVWRDLRLLSDISDNHKVFSTELPLYFQIDLAKEIIIDSVLSTNRKTQYAVLADLSLGSIKRAQLFDKRTVESLDERGVVVCQGGIPRYENGFLIYNGKHDSMMASHRKIMIENQLRQAITAPQTVYEQQIFTAYSQMMFHWLVATGKYPRSLETTAEALFNDFRSIVKNSFEFVVVDGGMKFSVVDELPTKPVVHRPSHFSMRPTSRELHKSGYSPAFCHEHFPMEIARLNEKWESLLRFHFSETEASASASAACTIACL